MDPPEYTVNNCNVRVAWKRTKRDIHKVGETSRVISAFTVLMWETNTGRTTYAVNARMENNMKKIYISNLALEPGEGPEPVKMDQFTDLVEGGKAPILFVVTSQMMTMLGFEDPKKMKIGVTIIKLCANWEMMVNTDTKAGPEDLPPYVFTFWFVGKLMASVDFKEGFYLKDPPEEYLKVNTNFDFTRKFADVADPPMLNIEQKCIERVLNGMKKINKNAVSIVETDPATFMRPDNDTAH